MDHETVGIAVEEDLYRNANPQGRGFRVHGRGHDDTTVRADRSLTLSFLTRVVEASFVPVSERL